MSFDGISHDMTCAYGDLREGIGAELMHMAKECDLIPQLSFPRADVRKLMYTRTISFHLHLFEPCTNSSQASGDTRIYREFNFLNRTRLMYTTQNSNRH